MTRPRSRRRTDEGYLCYDTEDFRTGYQAFLAKTKPGFKGVTMAATDRWRRQGHRTRAHHGRSDLRPDARRHGADVIKVEKVPDGDDTRRMVPPTMDGESAAFMILNRTSAASRSI